MGTLKTVLLGLVLAPLACMASEWDLRMDGIGPLRIGMRFDDANARLGRGLQRTEPGLRASQGCDQVEVPGHPGVALMFLDDVLSRIDVWGHDGRTAAGIVAGDSVQRVLDTYPHAASEPNAYDDRELYLTVRSPDGRLAIRFETREGKIAGFYAGRFKAVQFIEGCL
jgi:hypothetical protein